METNQRDLALAGHDLEFSRSCLPILAEGAFNRGDHKTRWPDVAQGLPR
jgi:hypothetical protein